MIKNPDNNYDYEGELAEIIHMSKALENKINSFTEESSKLKSITDYYNMLKEDISHMRENAVMKPQVGSKLNSLNKQILKRRREIKNIVNLFYTNGIDGKLDKAMRIINEAIFSYEEELLKQSKQRPYRMRTESGREILEMLMSENTRFTYEFNTGDTQETAKTQIAEPVKVKDIIAPVKEVEPITELVYSTPEPANQNCPIYSIKRKNKVWTMFNEHGISIISNKKLMVVIDYIIDSNIDSSHLIIQNEKHSFDNLYSVRKNELIKK